MATSRKEEDVAKRNKRKEEHISAENFNSVVFESEELISLSSLQDLLTTPEDKNGLPNSIARAKGFIYFDKFPETRFLFHWSGRRRYQITYDDTNSITHVSRLVIIGNDIDGNGVLETLSCLSKSTNSSNELLIEQKENAINIIKNDKLFEILSSEDDDIIYFRLTGVSTTSLTIEELDERFGLDFDGLNRDLIRSVNGSPGMYIV